MKLRNKKTGEIVEATDFNIISDYDSLAELNEEWEDYEEPKGNWTIEPMNENYIDDGRYTAPDELERYEELGLKFNTKEEAEKAVEKLKAWKRLKDKQFKFYGWNKGSLLKQTPNNITFACDDTKIWSWEDIRDDLDLLFRGEE